MKNEILFPSRPKPTLNQNHFTPCRMQGFHFCQVKGSKPSRQKVHKLQVCLNGLKAIFFILLSNQYYLLLLKSSIDNFINYIHYISIISNCTEMKRILLLVFLHIFSSISSFPQCYSLGGNAPLVVKRNQLLNEGIVLPVWGPEYEVIFDLKINSWSGGWDSIFRFSALSGNCETNQICKIGERVPAMFTRPGWQDKLLITTNIDSDGNRFFFNELGKFQNGTWYSFVISQNKSVGVFLTKTYILFEIFI